MLASLGTTQPSRAHEPAVVSILSFVDMVCMRASGWTCLADVKVMVGCIDLEHAHFLEGYDWVLRGHER